MPSSDEAPGIVQSQRDSELNHRQAGRDNSDEDCPEELKDADPELVAELARRYLFNSRYREIWELGEPDEPGTDEEWTAY